jgi:hypothetical protein
MANEEQVEMLLRRCHTQILCLYPRLFSDYGDGGGAWRAVLPETLKFSIACRTWVVTF